MININQPNLPTLSFKKFMKTYFKSAKLKKLADDIVNTVRDSVFLIKIVFNVIQTLIII